MLPLIKILTTGLLSVSFVILIRRLKVRHLGQRRLTKIRRRGLGLGRVDLTRFMHLLEKGYC